MDTSADETSDASSSGSARRYSYKFQRLRERIRAAIAAGELAGKLPGERSLARQFNVNAKTLSKALTDLAAEGVLERNIGLGTFVRDLKESPAPSQALKILLLDGSGEGSAFTDAFTARGLDVSLHTADGDLPPSLLAPYDLIVVASPTVTDDTIRDLIVRGKSVLTLDRLAKPYSAHSMLTHPTLAASKAAIDLVTLGHQKMLWIPDQIFDADDQRLLSEAVPSAEVRSTTIDNAAAAAKDGYTAAVCSTGTAGAVIEACRSAGVSVPDAFSVIAYGRQSGNPTCCGHYITNDMVVNAVADILSTGLPHRPLTLWLTCERTRVGTTAPPAISRT